MTTLHNFIRPLFFMLTVPAFAESVDLAKNLVFNMQRQSEVIERIIPYVDRLDKARLFVLQRSVEAVRISYEENSQAGKAAINFQTIRLLQNLVVQYRYSKSFLGWTDPRSTNSIYSNIIANDLKELKNLSEVTEEIFGLDDSPYTQITAQTFRQLQKLLQQLDGLAIEPKIKRQMRALWPSIGETIAVAEQGDRPQAFKKGIEMATSMRALYPVFREISSSSAGFLNILEIQGLVEFYAEYAQIEEGM